jgi:glutamate-1-semialdehyde 2,1-aminomutase
MFYFMTLVKIPVILIQGWKILFLLIVHSAQGKKKMIGSCLRQLLILMGPFYIKLGQVLSTRSDLLGPETIKALQRLQDEVPPMSQRQLKKIIKKAYPLELSNYFEEFNWTPLASASIAQVHLARTCGGERVAVKVVRMHVARSMRQNLRMLRFAALLIHWMIPRFRSINLPEKAREISRLLYEQTDMALEAHHQQTLYTLFQNHPFVQIPKVHPDLCTDAVLVMEAVEGIRAKAFAEVNQPAPLLAKRLQDMFYTMLYMFGYCHGDPHPGNIFFTPDGKIILVDFGIVAILTEDEKWGLASFYYAAIRKEWDIAVQRFTKYFVIARPGLIEAPGYRERLVQVLTHHFDRISGRWSTREFLRDVNAILRHFNARYTGSFTKAELATITCEGFITQVHPGIDLWENARKFSDHYSPYMNESVKADFDRFFEQKTPKSMALRDSAKDCLVASTHLDRYFFPSRYPLFVKSAEKATITDVDGNQYVDLSCGYGPHILGYGHPVVKQAIREAAESANLNAIGHEAEVELARILVDAFPAAEKAIFSNSGTEAVMHALRLCRALRNGAPKVAKFEGHYHGFSDQAMVSSWFRVKGTIDYPLPVAGCPGTPDAVVDNTVVLQYGHPSSLETLKYRAAEIACVIIEPNPMTTRTDEIAYLHSLRHCCTELGIPLIFDEVVSGFRFTYGGAQVLNKVDPDLTCLGKIIGGGLPCGAVVGKRAFIDVGKTTGDPFRDYEERVFLGGTMSGNYITCRVGIAVLGYLKKHPEIYRQLSETTHYLQSRMTEISRKYGVPAKIKGHYSIMTVVFSHRQAQFFRETMSGSNFKASLALAYYMRKYGVYMPEIHTFFLGAAHTRQDIETIIRAFDSSLQEMCRKGFFVL